MSRSRRGQCSPTPIVHSSFAYSRISWGMVPDTNMVEIRSLNRDFHFIQLRSAQGSGCIGFEFRAEGEERIFFDKVNSQCDTRHVSLFSAPNDICHDGIDPVDIALGELEGIEGATAFD